MIETIVRKLNNGLLFKVAFFLSIFGFLTIPLSASLGLSDLVLKEPFSPVGKQVGYLSALNWWPNYTVLIPSLVFMLGWLLKEIKQTHFKLFKSGMVLDSTTYEVVSSVEIIELTWNNWLKIAIKIWLTLAVFVVVFSYYECWSTSIYPTLYPNSANIVEVDWSIAPLFSEVNNTSNIVFNIFVFSLQGFGVSFAILMLCLSGTYGAFISQYSYSGEKWLLIPNINSSDSRKGFEIFEEVGTLLLILGLLAYLIIYLVILQNTYLDDPNSLSFIGGEQPFLNFNPKDAFGILVHFNESTAIVLMLGLAVIIVTLAVVPGAILSIAAKRARDSYKMIHEGENSDALSQMTWWPYKWLKTNVLIIAILLCLIGLFIPSVAPYLAGIFSSTIIAHVVWKFKKFFDVEST